MYPKEFIQSPNINQMTIQKSLPLPGDRELTEVDIEVNAEIMRRLLVFLGMQDLDAKKAVEKPQVIVKAKLINNNGKSLNFMNLLIVPGEEFLLR